MRLLRKSVTDGGNSKNKYPPSESSLARTENITVTWLEQRLEELEVNSGELVRTQSGQGLVGYCELFQDFLKKIAMEYSTRYFNRTSLAAVTDVG